MSDNNSLISGRIIDPHYFGDYYPDSTYIPESILINFNQNKIKEIFNDANLICKKLDWIHPYSQKWILIIKPENKIGVEIPIQVKI